MNKKIIKLNTEHGRQGDVLVIPVSEIPKEFVKTKQCTLALGEATGHHHTINTGAIGYATSTDGLATYFEVTNPLGADLTHQEHETIQFPEGKYRAVIQSEYRRKEFQSVVD